jgi:hypothetical protein
MHRVLAGFYIAVFFSVLSAAQVPFDAEGISALNVDDSMKGWKPVCVLPTCNPRRKWNSYENFANHRPCKSVEGWRLDGDIDYWAGE